MAAINSIDLSQYVRVGRYDLPEPTRTTPPANSLLAQEVSAVTYNPDTDTLFVLGDGGTSVVQVTKTGQLIDSMTLAPGGSPQGTDFYDPEGLTYVGGGKFVLVEERYRQANLFTYVPNTTLTRSGAQTVKLGTTIGNIGIEGISYDPLTNGFIAVKETQPEGIFQTGIDFAAGTATNGSATTENSTNLFNPALAGLADFADVFALSNLPSLSGQPDFNNLLILSQESGKIVEIDRSGNVASSLTIVSDPGNPLSVPDQQHEGLTVDRDGNLYVVSENGGGDIDHPQLWVYAPSAVINQAPSAVLLNNLVSMIAENTSTATRLKVADVAVTDDGLGTNALTLTGADASAFEVDSSGLYIKAGTVLDYETKTSYSVTVNVDDSTVGSTPDASKAFTLAVTDIVNEAPASSPLIISEVAPWSSGNSPLAADWFEVTNKSASAVDITGWKIDDNSNAFGSAVALNGVTSIGAGESVIFIESSATNQATVVDSFKSLWFGGSAPATLKIGTYTGSGVGLSTAGDAVNLFNSAGALQANVTFGASPAGPFPTFDNAAGLNNAAISQLSAVGSNGAFTAASDAKEIGSPGAIAAPKPAPAYTLQLLHYYGESGLLAVQTAPILGALVDKFDDQYTNTLKLAEGDTYIPGPWLVGGSDPSLSSVAGIGSTALGRPDVAILNALGTNASALGNHEFDLGSPVLQGAIAASGAWVGAKFPFITDNLDFSADSSLRGLTDATLGGTATNDFAGKEASVLQGKIAPYTVVTQGGEKIGIVGATTYDLLSKTSPNGTVVKDDGNPSTDDLQEVAAYIQSSVNALKALGVNKIVMVDQLDTIERNKLLAPLVSGIDVMIAGGGHERLGDATDVAAGFNGHTADFVGTYPIVTAGADGKTTLIVTTDTEYSYLGRLVVDFDANGEIIVSNLDPTINGAYASTEATLQAAYGTTQTADQIVASSTIGTQIKGITDAINTVIITKDSNVFGYTNVYLEGDRAFGRAQEVNLGDISADANLFKAKAALGTGTVLASLKNGGGIRASVGSIGEDGSKQPPAASSVKPAGAISQLDIENALRFDNKLMVFDATPQGLLNILNYGAGLAPGNGGYPQIGGVRFSYDPTKAAGQRVQDVAVYDLNNNLVAKIADNGVILPDAPAKISVVVLNFTANGGDGYPIKENADNFRYLLSDGTLSAPIDEALDFTAAVNVPVNTLGEQKAFEDYLQANYSTPQTAYAMADTPATQDQRIQNLQVKAVDTVLPPITYALIISEVTPWSSGNSAYAADWFEVTNVGKTAVDITGWKIDDNSNSFGSAVTLNGVSSIAAGQSVVFIEGSADTANAFKTAWFGTKVPSDFVIGTYSGSGVGLSTAGDAVNLFDASGNRVTGVSFGSSTGSINFTFDNAAGLGSTALPLPAVSTLSAVGVNGAFLAADGLEVGSPGAIKTVNLAPTAVGLNNSVTALAENVSTATRIKVADIAITDDGIGTNVLSLSGADAGVFEIEGTALYLKANTKLNFDLKPTLTVSVAVDDLSVGATPDAANVFTLNLTSVPSLVSGTSGNDDLTAGLTPGLNGINDLIFAGAGNDTVDTAIAGAAAGNNRIDLGSGNDRIFVANGDTAFGSTGDDILDAADAKNYRLSGGAGNDTFFLGSNGRALGGDGNDKFFVGTGGGNLLSGGAGADQFWIANAEIPAASNTILDFQIGTDVIGIQGAASLGISASTLVLTQMGADTAISFGGHELALLKGIASTGLNAADSSQFVLV